MWLYTSLRILIPKRIYSSEIRFYPRHNESTEECSMSSKTCMYLKEKKNVIFTSSVNNTWKEDQEISEATIQFIWYHSFIAAAVMAINTIACSKFSPQAALPEGRAMSVPTSPVPGSSVDAEIVYEWRGLTNDWMPSWVGFWSWLQLSQFQLSKTEEWGKKLKCESVILIWLDSINIIIASNKYTALSL